ncbi:MAG TPA: glycosyltransferase, partial [bacterium]|nr:glycosyltransferase [bacterium]
MNSFKVSVVIPTMNRKEILKACLTSVFKQTFDAVEVIVVDNNSTDGTGEMVKQCFPDVMLLENGRNLGPAEARNQAIRICRGDFLWFLDSDTIVLDAQCLSFMVSALAEHDDIGAIGAEMIEEKT